jgi:hypothetical protein
MDFLVVDGRGDNQLSVPAMMTEPYSYNQPIEEVEDRPRAKENLNFDQHTRSITVETASIDMFIRSVQRQLIAK